MADDPKAESAGRAAPGATPAIAATAFTSLAEIVYSASDATEIYSAICVAATLIVPGCDHASLLVKRNNRYYTVGASSRLAQQVCDLEQQADDGPCIDAIEDETPQVEADLSGATQWPKFAALLRDNTPVRGVMGFRLRIDKRKGAALNLFSEMPNRFDTEAAGRAAVLASFASVAVNAVHHGENAKSLRQGLHTNREIGKAIGILMILNDTTEEEAFDLLRRRSQKLNTKLAEVARQVIDQRGAFRA